MRIIIAGKEIMEQQILQWEQERVMASKRFLEKKLKAPVPVTNAEELAQFKNNLSDEQIQSCLQSTLKRTTAMTNAFTKLAGTKRKISIAEIYLDFCNAVQLHEMYDDMMLNNTSENRFSCLRANPDHYLLKGVNATEQEVIEFTGGLPFPIQFTIRYGDFNGLVSEQETAYPVQAAGASYLNNGFCIGAVRHQIADTKNGCKVKLSVEFPALLPKKNIEAHERHLAIEFYNWFSEFDRRIKSGKQTKDKPRYHI